MCLSQTCVKVLVFIFNFLFVLVGAGLISLGAFYLANYNTVTDVIPEDYSSVRFIPILTITVGAIIFVISFFGCCGAWTGSTCLLTTYAVILLVLFILQVTLGVFTFLSINDQKDLSTKVNRTVDDLFSKALQNNKTIEVVDFIQTTMECCGVRGPDYWKNQTIPKTCYPNEDPQKNVYQAGCQGKVLDFILSAGRIFGITILSLSATEVIGAIAALCLANSLRNDFRRSPYYCSDHSTVI